MGPCYHPEVNGYKSLHAPTGALHAPAGVRTVVVVVLPILAVHLGMCAARDHFRQKIYQSGGGHQLRCCGGHAAKVYRCGLPLMPNPIFQPDLNRTPCPGMLTFEAPVKRTSQVNGPPSCWEAPTSEVVRTILGRTPGQLVRDSIAFSKLVMTLMMMKMMMTMMMMMMMMKMTCLDWGPAITRR